jgi:hypothetical protein
LKASSRASLDIGFIKYSTAPSRIGSSDRSFAEIICTGMCLTDVFDFSSAKPVYLIFLVNPYPK